ncbi:hypothetical protein [Segetibacter aerophilus]|uniref:Entericidin n=1 Tax=Segetibacter aerophilus TaxID=670293 RepID=A0A512BG51_9BACT|nr:hypothetical protein [Segetibacter aerophilus]GEO10855.1 hypothetical protein SAE01_33510 [Segetibacter aerophilus]
MKKLLFVFLLGAFAACGGGDSTSTSDSTTVSTDASSSTGTMSTDTTGTGAMSTDTTSMSTPH